MCTFQFSDRLEVPLFICIVTASPVIMACKEVGCSKIIGVDANPDKEAVARSFGLTHFINVNALPEGQTAVEVGCVCTLA